MTMSGRNLLGALSAGAIAAAVFLMVSILVALSQDIFPVSMAGQSQLLQALAKYLPGILVASAGLVASVIVFFKCQIISEAGSGVAGEPHRVHRAMQISE